MLLLFHQCLFLCCPWWKPYKLNCSTRSDLWSDVQIVVNEGGLTFIYCKAKNWAGRSWRPEQNRLNIFGNNKKTTRDFVSRNLMMVYLHNYRHIKRSTSEILRIGNKHCFCRWLDVFSKVYDLWYEICGGTCLQLAPNDVLLCYYICSLRSNVERELFDANMELSYLKNAQKYGATCAISVNLNEKKKCLVQAAKCIPIIYILHRNSKMAYNFDEVF